MSMPVRCPDCHTEMTESVRFCPGCGLPRTRVEAELRAAADLTGIPYEELLERAREDAALRHLPRVTAIERPVKAQVLASSAGADMRSANNGNTRRPAWQNAILVIVGILAVIWVVDVVSGSGASSTSASRLDTSTNRNTSSVSVRSTSTPTPQVRAPGAPKKYSGSGDDVITISKPDGADMPALLRVIGNNSGRHFAVKGFDSSGRSTGLFVNTTDAYQGLIPLDFRDSDNTVRLEISATGLWSIEVRSLVSARTVRVGSTESGSGDDVFLISGSVDTAHVSGNKGSRHFAVLAYGNRSKLLVNTTSPYDGRVALPQDTVVIEVTAKGSWRIKLE